MKPTPFHHRQMGLFLFQEALDERVKRHREWKDNEVTLAKKREIKVRMELAHKTDKINEASREISEVSFASRLCTAVQLSAACFNFTYFVRLPYRYIVVWYV